MAASLQVIYPIGEDTHFDHDDFTSTHLRIVDDTISKFVQSRVWTKGVAGGPDAPPGFHVIATFTFADGAALNAALGAAGPALADIPNFTNVQPQTPIGEVIA